MSNEYYFSKNVDENTWEHFLTEENQRNLKSYRRLEGYGWKDTFGFNYKGEALYISSEGIKYKGIWFNSGDRRIAVFKE